MDSSPTTNISHNSQIKKKAVETQDKDMRSRLRLALQKPSEELDLSGVHADFSTQIMATFKKKDDFGLTLTGIIDNHFALQAKNFKVRSLIRKSLKKNENIDLNPSQRNKMWLILTDYYQKSEWDYYSKLVQLSQKKYPDHYLKMIELDVHRTLINPSISEDQKIDLISKLRNVLNAYAIRNPYIGYCQGFNFIIAELLIAEFTEIQAFWIFVYILEVLLPLDYYSSMIGIMVDQRIFLELLRLISPEIVNKFLQFNIDCSFFTLQWFVCLFCGIANKDIFKLIWDHFLVFGSYYLFKIGLTMIEITKPKWFYAEDFPELLMKLEESVKSFDDVRSFQAHLHNFYLNKNIIAEVSEILRTIFKKNVREKSRRMKIKTQGLLISNGKPAFCEERSPLCLDLLEKNRIKKRAVSFFVFREGTPPEILVEYLDEDSNNKKQQKTGKYDETERLMIGRHHHICNGKYVKTKPRNTDSLQGEIEMQELNPTERIRRTTDHFIIKKNSEAMHFLDNPNLELSSLGFKVKQKFFKIFNILCLRDKEKTENNTGYLSKKMAFRGIPFFESSEFNSSLLNSRKTYESGSHLWKDLKAFDGPDLKDCSPEDFMRDIDLQIESIEKVENLRESRSMSFNSSFRDKYVSSRGNFVLE